MLAPAFGRGNWLFKALPAKRTVFKQFLPIFFKKCHLMMKALFLSLGLVRLLGLFALQKISAPAFPLRLPALPIVVIKMIAF